MFIRVETDILLANYFGSANYKRDGVTLSALRRTCKHLAQKLPGYALFDLDLEKVEEVASIYPDLYVVKGEKVWPGNYKPNRVRFNELYPPSIAERIEAAVDDSFNDTPEAVDICNAGI